MLKDEYYVIGVMSGTSLDGLDLVYAQFKRGSKWIFNIIHAETVSYNGFWIETLKGLVDKTTAELEAIDDNYTLFLAKKIQGFIKKHGITNLDAICSHGHTALHEPEKQFTYQIGNRAIISKLLNRKVVCDFRVQDVELGGQGAPLVPIGDKLLFSEYDFCLNLGGFSNISLDFEDKRIAYDICPVNIVLNCYINRLGFDYDDQGKKASMGSINKDLLVLLNQLEFYRLPPPKSLGLEWVKSNIFPLIEKYGMEVQDILHTFCEHIAIQLSKEINKKNNASVLVTGGGVYNTYLMERLQLYSTNKITVPDKTLIEFKEALIFAFLGVLKLRNEVNCLKSVTGALKNHSSGVIFYP
ncbi:anhydro-N-acetylmuramic acid kinase [Hyunsoonleella jejuensis]|uniref:Anhydro-N-acetylmuramic acid kinase n=1 Tax=Hyunsoonleella jejuensis TaxID=419940 RepID=A0A1H9I5K7_9FLAO|nr:anhydro-N-acetylmuramic acid kinase [Hyunsoonleella jejuensis]SEQ69864.1 anhydro-N-acetylmuramic acid kinase [Hyunsoonleella jejuensis]